MLTPSDAIRNWLHYVQTGHASPDLMSAESRLGAQRLRVVLIKILGWLKAQVNRTAPLSLNANHEWTQNLLVFISAVPDVVMLRVANQVLDFDAALPLPQRDEVLALVSQYFEPPLMIRPQITLNAPPPIK